MLGAVAGKLTMEIKEVASVKECEAEFGQFHNLLDNTDVMVKEVVKQEDGQHNEV